MLKTEKYFVGYLDLLGVKEAIKEDENKYLNLLHQCYNRITSIIKEMGKLYKTEFSVKIFSDNIIFAVKADKHILEALDNIIVFVGSFQRMLLEENLLSRGSIAYGDLYIDDLMVFGNALVEAYQLESTCAIYPRVVISDKTMELIESSYFKLSELGISKDFDDVPFLNYFMFILNDEIGNTLKSNALKNIEDKILKEDNLKIRAKLQWQKNYILNHKDD